MTKAKKIDGRKNNGGHKTAGRKKLYMKAFKKVTLDVPECEHSELKKLERKIKDKYLIKKIIK